MRATRFATFLMGAWIGCCVFMDLLALQNLRLVGRTINSASPAAADIIRKNGQEQVTLLLHHFAAEQYRYYFSMWERIQVPGALLVAAVLYLAVGRRWIPQMLCGLMLALVLFQLAIQPELTFRGREADFPPGSQALGTQARVWALTGGLDGGGIRKAAHRWPLLTGFMLGYKSRTRPPRRAEMMTSKLARRRRADA